MFSGALQDAGNSSASVENPIGLAGGHACSLLNQWLQTPAQVKDEECLLWLSWQLSHSVTTGPSQMLKACTHRPCSVPLDYVTVVCVGGWN